MKKPNTIYSAWQIVKWLWRSSSDNRLQAILNTAIGLLEVATSLASVWAVQNAIDIASHYKEGDIYVAVAFMGGLIACNLILRIASVWVKNILGIRAQNRMQSRMLGRILHSEWRGRESMHSGDILNRLEQDVNNVVNFVAETLPNTIAVFSLFVGAFYILFLQDHMLALLILTIFPIFLVLSKLYVGKMRFLARDVRDSDSLVQSVLQDSVQNRMLVKTLESEEVMLDRLAKQHHSLRKKVVRKTKFSVFSNTIVSMGFATGYLLAFGWSALRMSVGTLTFGGMTAFLQLVNKIQGPARNLTKLAPQFVSVFTAAERLMLFEDFPLEEMGDSISIAAPLGVKVENVTYAYEDDKSSPVVSDLSFDFKPGTCTAVLGETGVGKTTLIRLILSLVKPDKGSIYIYNKVSSVPVSPLTRCNVIYVPQGNTLLSGTIRDNLFLGNVEATEEDMFWALSVACAEFVKELPMGLDTEISEQGEGLSEGQAQRICIARALLRKASLMILDESTSALDPETEKQLLTNLLSNNERTVIFITHRLSVLDYCQESLKLG